MDLDRSGNLRFGTGELLRTEARMKVAGIKLSVIALVAVGVVTPQAHAAGWSCEASAVRAAVLGSPLAEPVVANKGQALCRTATGASTAGLPSLLSVSTLAAQTGVAGPEGTPGAQTVTASGGLVDLGLRILPSVPIKLPVDDVVERMEPLSVPLPTLPGLPSSISVDLRPALRAAVPNGGLPDTDLVRVRSAVAYASGRCAGSGVQLDGTSRVAGVSVLGQDLPLSGAIAQTFQLVSGRTVDPSSFDLSSIALPGIAPELVPVVQTALKPALDALPDITIPATLAQIGIQPGTQERSGGRLVQRALTVSVSILGQRLADTIVGEAIVGSDDVTCTTGNVAEAALQCTTRRLVLTDVFARGGRVVLTGAADRRYIGKRVRIFFPHQRRYVASAVVRKDGTFRTTAALPARRLRGTNLARYQARIGKERSLRLKLQRRMIVRTVRVSGSKVRISGRITRPLAAPAQRIVISQRVSCTKSKVVARVTPRRDGTFSVTVKAPPKQQAAVYRLATRVRKTMRNPKTFPTFTLPRYVDLGR
jgi:hypothetical protein